MMRIAVYLGNFSGLWIVEAAVRIPVSMLRQSNFASKRDP